MAKNICFLLGGSKLSGAERRIIITAMEFARDKNFKVMLITSKELKEEYDKSDLAHFFSEVALLWRTRELSRSSNKYVRGSYNFLISIFLNLFQLSFFSGTLHVVLFSSATIVSLLPVRAIGRTIFIYEVTSPDVARSIAVKALVKFKFLLDGFICVSESVRKQLPGQDGAKIMTREQPLAYVGRGEGVGKTNRVVFAHRLTSRKNPLIALQAFAVLAREFSDWSFLICGDGELRDEVRRQVSAACLDNFDYLGYVYDMDKLVRGGRIFVSLIEPDNYPSQSVLNAMANGNVLVVSDTGDSKRKFIDGNGCVVAISVDGVVEGVRKLIMQGDLDEMSRRSAQLFQARYSLELYLRESKEFYH